MAPVPESDTSDEQQPVSETRRAFFSTLIGAPVHDVTPVVRSVRQITN